MTLAQLLENGFNTADFPSFAHVDVRVAQLLRALWLKLHMRPDVTSSYRTPEENAAVGGATNSMHLQGKAVDVVFPTIDPAVSVKAAKEVGFTGIAVQWPTAALHLDVRDTPASWGEIVNDDGSKSFNHTLADTLALFQPAVADATATASDPATAGGSGGGGSGKTLLFLLTALLLVWLISA